MRGLRVALVVTLSLAGTARAQQEQESCVDTWPEDRERPELRETFPLRGTSGHVSVLEVEVEHLPGETVFPAGVVLDRDSEEAERLKLAEFQFPRPSSRVGATLQRQESKDGKNRALTSVDIPLIPLPAEAGRKELTLPRLPISVARASGQVHTLCTQPHIITVEDPLASKPAAKQKPDPPPRPQIEVWETMRDAVLAALIALPVALLLVWLFFRYRSGFKRAPKPPPPVPPWETALRELDDIEARNLLTAEKYEEYLDEVSDALRKYLGERYGFDGLESTTRETLRQLATLAADFDEDRAVRTILQRADLVKFARRPPSEEECRDAMSETRRLIRKTTVKVRREPKSGEEDSRG